VPGLTLDVEGREAARERLERAHIRLGERPLIGLYPSIMGGGGVRPWPRVRFEDLMRQLRRRQPKMQCVILATPEDLWRAVRLYEETGKIHPVIGPDLQIDVLAALLGELDLVIAAESSMLDLAAAVGTATVGLHLRDPRRWAPPGERHVAISAGKAGTLGAIQVAEVLSRLDFSAPSQ
jgi:ADP-heptose:LPS heptosyltransferase